MGMAGYSIGGEAQIMPPLDPACPCALAGGWAGSRIRPAVGDGCALVRHGPLELAAIAFSPTPVQLCAAAGSLGLGSSCRRIARVPFAYPLHSDYRNRREQFVGIRLDAVSMDGTIVKLIPTRPVREKTVRSSPAGSVGGWTTESHPVAADVRTAAAVPLLAGLARDALEGRRLLHCLGGGKGNPPR